VRLNQTSNTGLIYQPPAPRKKQFPADDLLSGKEATVVDSAPLVSDSDEKQKTTAPLRTKHATVSSGHDLDIVPIPVFKKPELSDLPIRSQKAIFAYQSAAAALPSAGVEIVGIDLFV
jgi:hypothetical protein